eukprot:scaffold263400_cov18-Prasinocladus_malaysianus.AAC.1
MTRGPDGSATTTSKLMHQTVQISDVFYEYEYENEYENKYEYEYQCCHGALSAAARRTLRVRVRV